MKFDFDVPIERAGTWSTRWDRYRDRDVIPLWVADSDFRTAPAVLQAVEERVRHGVFGYTRAPEELREAIVARLERLYRWRVDPSWIVFLPGVVPGLHLAARALIAPDQHALVPTPLYQHFKRALQLAPREHTDLPLTLDQGRWVFDEDVVRRSMRHDTRLFFLCNPQNPGGTVFSRTELERIAELTRDALIVSDEIHCDLVLDAGKRHVPIANLAPEVSSRTVTLMSPSKAFNIPAASCAWAIIENPEVRRAFSVDVDAHVVYPMSVFGFVAALAAYRSGDEWLAAQVEYLRGNRDLVERGIDLPLAHVEATYLAWIDCSPLGVADAHAHFLAHGVALSPGAQFGEPRYVRLNFGTQRARLEEALRRIRNASTPSPRG